MSISKVNGIYYQYFTNPNTGKRTRVSTGKRLKSEALEVLKNQNKVSQKTEKTLLPDLRQVVLNYLNSNNYAESTIYIYEQVFNQLINLFPSINIPIISIRELEKWKECRLKEVSPSRLNIEICSLKSLFNIAVRLGYLTSNPSTNIKKLKIDQSQRLSFTDEELERLLNTIPDARFKKMILFTAFTGLRIGEVLNVQMKDITNDVLIVRNKENFRTKTGKIREIPISNKLEGILEIESHFSNPDAYLFSNPDGGKYDKHHISKRFSKYLKKAGLDERFHFHCLRHTFITNLIKKGVSIYFVKELAGHADIKTTEGYTHLATEDLRMAVNCL